MKTVHKSIAALLAALLIGGSGLALAGDRCHDRGEGGRHGAPMRALSQLESLSDEQRAQIKDLFRTQRDTMRERRDAMQDNREALREAMQSGADEATLRPLANKQGELVSEMIMARAQMQQQLSAILTEEQMTELKKMRKERFDDDDKDYGHRRW
jgi:protein CpxP